jgi:hypothetical protein
MVDSLRLRETTTDTSLRATTGEAGLRSDNYAAPINTTSEASISAKVTSYTEDSKEWGVVVHWLADSLPDSSTPSSGNINIAEVQIRYAWDGYPELWNDGDQLALYNSSNDGLSPAVHTGVRTDTQLSNWVYYSLFFKYIDSNALTYVSRVATTSVLIPTKHGMGEAMFNHVPKYYRYLDKTEGSGHLQKYIEVFGWEADYFRSLVDELMVVKDPYRVHYDSLDQLASNVGLPYTSAEMRPYQLRELIYDSDRYYDQKGRPDALVDLLSVISDSEVSCREFTNTGASPTSAYQRAKFTISASRLNLITNPRFVGTPSSSGTWNVLTSASAGTVTVNHSAATGVTITTGGSDAGTAYIFPRKAVQVKRFLNYYSSVAASLTNATAKVRLYREAPTSAGSLPDQSKYFVTDDSSSADYYRSLTKDSTGGDYSTGAFQQRVGFYLTPSTAEANAVYTTTSTPVNGGLFRARLYTSTAKSLRAFSLKLTRVDTHPASGSRFDRFDLAVHDGSANVLTATNLTVNTSGQVIDEDDSSVVTKLTNTTGGVTYTLFIDDVTTLSYAATTQLPSDDTSTFAFRDTGVEQLYPVIVVDLSNSGSATLDQWIFQPFYDGDYFDGTTLEGHSYISGGAVTSDYYWSGTANDSASIYTPVRHRNRATLRKALLHNLPVTMSKELTSANYHTDTNHGHQVVFDAVPGDEHAFDPHSWTAGVYTEGTITTNSD